MLTFASLFYLPSSDMLTAGQTPPLLMKHSTEILGLASEAMLILLFVVIYITEIVIGLKPLDGTDLHITNAINYDNIRQPYFSTAL